VTVGGEIYRNPSSTSTGFLFNCAATTFCFTIFNDICYFGSSNFIRVNHISGTFLLDKALSGQAIMDLKVVGGILFVVSGPFGSTSPNSDNISTFDASTLALIEGPITLPSSSTNATVTFQNSIVPHPSENIVYITATSNDRLSILLYCVTFNLGGTGITIRSAVAVPTTNLIINNDPVGRFVQLRFTYRDGVIQFVFNDGATIFKLATIQVDEDDPTSLSLVSVTTLPSAFNGSYLPFASTPSGTFLFASTTQLRLALPANASQKYINPKPLNLPSDISCSLTAQTFVLSGLNVRLNYAAADLICNMPDINENTFQNATNNIFTATRKMLIHFDMIFRFNTTNIGGGTENIRLTASTTLSSLQDCVAINFASPNAGFGNALQLHGIMQVAAGTSLSVTYAFASGGSAYSITPVATSSSVSLRFLRYIS